MKAESWIIMELGVALFILALLSFIWTPSYEKGAWFAIGVFSNGLNLVLGYKFGKGMPEQVGDPKSGRATTSQTTSTTKTEAPGGDAASAT
jgi:hypothetical protein